MFDRHLIRELLEMTAEKNNDLHINDRYVCKFEAEKARVFSQFEKNENCKRITCSANVEVFDQLKNTKRNGNLFLHYDLDLDKYSLNLFFDQDKTSIFIAKMQFS